MVNYRGGGGSSGGGGGGDRTSLVARIDHPMSGGAAVIQLPVADYRLIEVAAGWFFGADTDTLPLATYRGFTHGQYVADGGGSSVSIGFNTQNGFEHFIQNEIIAPAISFTIGILNRTNSNGWSIEFNPDTYTLSLLEYAETGAGSDGRPNIDAMLVSAVVAP